MKNKRNAFETGAKIYLSAKSILGLGCTFKSSSFKAIGQLQCVSQNFPSSFKIAEVRYELGNFIT